MYRGGFKLISTGLIGRSVEMDRMHPERQEYQGPATITTPSLCIEDSDLYGWMELRLGIRAEITVL